MINPDSDLGDAVIDPSEKKEIRVSADNYNKSWEQEKKVQEDKEVKADKEVEADEEV